MARGPKRIPPHARAHRSKAKNLQAQASSALGKIAGPPRGEPGHDIIVVGASMGGVEALQALVGGLPPDLPASLFIVQHLWAEGVSILPKILDNSGPLRAAWAADGERPKPGHVYVAPIDRHLLVEAGRMRLDRGARENGQRPAVDVLFRSAANAYGPRVVGVVLTGSLDCGTAGLLSVKRQGGLAVVQDPKDAFCPSMPSAALHHVSIDHCVLLREMPGLLVSLVATAPKVRGSPSALEIDPLHGPLRGTPSDWTCPECGGPLRQIEEGKLLRFRCQVGHAYSSGSLLLEKASKVEAALWAAQSALMERARLQRSLETRAQRWAQGGRSAARFAEEARDAEARAALIRAVLLDPDLFARHHNGEELVARALADQKSIGVASSPEGG